MAVSLTQRSSETATHRISPDAASPTHPSISSAPQAIGCGVNEPSRHPRQLHVRGNLDQELLRAIRDSFLFGPCPVLIVD